MSLTKSLPSRDAALVYFLLNAGVTIEVFALMVVDSSVDVLLFPRTVGCCPRQQQ